MTAEPVRVRTAGPGDVGGVWPLARDLAVSFRPERAAFDIAYARLLDEPGTLLLVAVTPDGGVVGYLLAHSHLTFQANGPVAWVEEIMVAARMRRSGVGRWLMGAAEEWALSLDAAYLALATRRAGDFYTALGYEESATFFRKLLVGPPLR